MTSTKKPRGRPLGIFDLSDIVSEDSKGEEIRNLQAQNLARAASEQGSRILSRNQSMDEKCLIAREDSIPGTGLKLTSSGRAPPTSSKTRTNAALMKLAQIETKILSRKKVPMTLSDTESDSKTTDEGLPKRADATASFQHTHKTFRKQVCETPIAKSNGQSGKASRFLKKKEPPVENRSLGPPAEKGKSLQTPGQKGPARKSDVPDSDEEEMKVLLGSLMESSTERDRCRSRGLTSTELGERDRGKALSDQTPTQPALSVLSVDRSSSRASQPSRLSASQSAEGTLRSIGPRTLLPRTQDAGDTASLTASLSISNDFSKSTFSRMGCIKLASSPSRDKARPSQELVSEASSDSLHGNPDLWAKPSFRGRAGPPAGPSLVLGRAVAADFRVNILSIDDLAPTKWENSNLEQKEESAGREGLSGRSSLRMSPAQPVSAAFQGTAVPGEDDLATESDVSEHLDASSASSVQSHRVSSIGSAETPVSHTASLAYTEDFEQFSSALASEKSLDRTLDTSSQFSSSLKTDFLPIPPPAGTKWARDRTRVVKEMAVQTLDPAFTYQWTRADSVAAIGPVLGGAYVDPVPIASHVVSADAIEALTAYSPAALALNDMLKQQLSLTQQFIEASRQLHTALLQSLDEDSFHYHTLEEAREYIRCHRPTPLTMEAALQEVKAELQVSPAGSCEDT